MYFCQEEKSDKLKTIMVLEGTSKKILDASKYHKILSVKVANVIDLVAAGPAKYHLKCYSQFLRHTASIKESADRNGKAMAWLISEIKHHAKKGHVLHLDEVYHYYETLYTEIKEEIQASFLSRKCTFKEKLSELLIGIYEFHTLEYGKGTVMVPTEFVKTPISKFLSEESGECEVGLPLYKPDDDIFLSLIHVALKLRGDILSHPAYTGFDVSQQAAVSCIPQSLHMFLKVLYGGDTILENNQEDDNNDDDDDDDDDDNDDDDDFDDDDASSKILASITS